MKNSRMIVRNPKTGKPFSIKKPEVSQAFHDFIIQAKNEWGGRPPVPQPATLKATIYYPSKRSDLDDGMLMDVLEKARIVENDRHIWRKEITKGINKDLPRVDFDVIPME